MGESIYIFKSAMKVFCLLLLVAVAAQAENCQVYKNGIESIFSKLPVVKSASEPNDGVCEDGEGWGCIAEIGVDPQGVQKCVEEAIGTASDCWDCVCWVMESVDGVSTVYTNQLEKLILRLQALYAEQMSTDLRRERATWISAAAESTGPTLPAGSIAETVGVHAP